MKTGPVKRVIRRFAELGGDTEKADSVIKYWRTNFSVAADADYSFSACVYEEGGASLAASRVDTDEDEYFWARSYNRSEFEDTKVLLNTLVEDVSSVLQHSSRVVQTKGLLTYSFSCEYFRDGAWTCLHKTRASRLGGFRFPPTKQRVTVYSSPPRFSVPAAPANKAKSSGA